MAGVLEVVAAVKMGLVWIFREIDGEAKKKSETPPGNLCQTSSTVKVTKHSNWTPESFSTPAHLEASSFDLGIEEQCHQVLPFWRFNKLYLIRGTPRHTDYTGGITSE